MTREISASATRPLTVVFPYQFSTKRLEISNDGSSTLYDFGARWYDPTTWLGLPEANCLALTGYRTAQGRLRRTTKWWDDPSVGRFLSMDPAGFTDGTNLYTYVGNDPVNMIDPVGLSRWDVQARTALSVFQRGLAGALSVLEQPREILTTRLFLAFDANRHVWVPIEGHAYQVLRPFQHLQSTVQGLGLLLGGLNIVSDSLELAAGGRLNVTQAREMIAVRGLETEGNAAAAWAGAKIGARLGARFGPYGMVGGAAIGGIVGGTGMAWLTRSGGDWVLESLEVPTR